MKTTSNLIWGLILLIGLMNCQPQESISAQEEQNRVKTLQMIEGGWLSEEYINALEKYQSPSLALAHGGNEPQCAFDISQINGDTVINFRGRLHNNESENYELIFLKNGDLKLNINRPGNTNQYRIKYRVNAKDTSLQLIISGKITDTITYQRQFRKFPLDKGEYYTAMGLCINRNLFAGDWLYGSDTVRFTENGLIENFIYDHYSVKELSDYPLSSPDEIYMYKKDEGKNYSWVLKDHSLELYEFINPVPGSLNYTRGELVCRLKRIESANPL
jgi:hypothetical protein